MNIKEKITEVGSAAKEHSTTILTVLTCVGVVATIVSAFKAAPELEEIESQKSADVDDILEDDLPKEERDEKIAEVNKKARKDKFFAMLPTFIFGSLTIGSAIVTEKINHKKIEGLKLDLKDMAVAYAVLEKKDINFKEKAKELLGQGKVEKIESEIMRDKVKEEIEGKSDVEVINTGKGTTWFYFVDSGQACLLSKQALDDAKNKFNSELLSSGAYELAATEFFYYLGLPEPKLAENLIFSQDHLLDYSMTIGPVYFNGENHDMHMVEIIGNKRAWRDNLL